MASSRYVMTIEDDDVAEPIVSDTEEARMDWYISLIFSQEKPQAHSKKKKIASELNPDFSFEEEQAKIASWIPQDQLIPEHAMVHIPRLFF